jgi:hypothetical protein
VVINPAVIEDSDDEDDARSFEPIDLLQDAGINATDIARLKEDGFATIGQLFQVSQKRLLAVKGISEAKMEKLLQAGRKVLSSGSMDGVISVPVHNIELPLATTRSKWFRVGWCFVCSKQEQDFHYNRIEK